MFVGRKVADRWVLVLILLKRTKWQQTACLLDSFILFGVTGREHIWVQAGLPLNGSPVHCRAPMYRSSVLAPSFQPPELLSPVPQQTEHVSSLLSSLCCYQLVFNIFADKHGICSLIQLTEKLLLLSRRLSSAATCTLMALQQMFSRTSQVIKHK